MRMTCGHSRFLVAPATGRSPPLLGMTRYRSSTRRPASGGSATGAPRRAVILSGEFVRALSRDPPRRNLGRGKRSFSPVSPQQPGDPDLTAYADDLWTFEIPRRSCDRAGGAA